MPQAEPAGRTAFLSLAECWVSFSPSFHGVEEANTICWATDLDQVLPAHPQEVSTCKESSRESARGCRTLLFPRKEAPKSAFEDNYEKHW